MPTDDACDDFDDYLTEAYYDPCPICGTNRGGGDCPNCYREDYEDQAIVEVKPIV